MRNEKTCASIVFSSYRVTSVTCITTCTVFFFDEFLHEGDWNVSLNKAQENHIIKITSQLYNFSITRQTKNFKSQCKIESRKCRRVCENAKTRKPHEESWRRVEWCNIFYVRDKISKSVPAAWDVCRIRATTFTTTIKSYCQIATWELFLFSILFYQSHSTRRSLCIPARRECLERFNEKSLSDKLEGSFPHLANEEVFAFLIMSQRRKSQR